MKSPRGAFRERQDGLRPVHQGEVGHPRTKEPVKDAAAVFAPDDRQDCLLRSGEMADPSITAPGWRSPYPAVAATFEEGMGDRPGRSPARAETVKKPTKVVGTFPSRARCDRPTGAQLVEVHEDWLTEAKAYHKTEACNAGSARLATA